MINRLFVAVLALASVATVGTAATQGAAVTRSGQIAWKGFLRAGDESTSAIYAPTPMGRTDGSSRIRLPASPTTYLIGRLTIAIVLSDLRLTTNRPTVADEVMRVNADGSGCVDRHMHGRLHRE